MLFPLVHLACAETEIMSDEVNDFFARKDKSKKKGSKSKKKFTTSSEIAQHVETQVQAQAERDYAVNAPAPVRPAKRTKVRRVCCRVALCV